MFSAKSLMPAMITVLMPFIHASAYGADAKNCRDPGGIGRFQGSSLVMCANKDFAEYMLPTGPMESFDFDKNKAMFLQQLMLEGRLVQNVYAVPPGASSAQVFRNYRQSLQGSSYSILYEGKQSDLGENFGHYFESTGVGTQLFGYSPAEARYLAASKDEAGAKSYIALYVIEYDDGFDRNFEAAKGQVLVRLDTVQVGQLADRMAVPSASEIDRRLHTEGHIALYGIHFDFNSAFVRLDSEAAIDQIALYLRTHPDRGLDIVGHTDNVGGPEFNQQLSQARSAAVADALVSRYGISRDRLLASGAGMGQPVAANDSEEGRALNRRVELRAR